MTVFKTCSKIAKKRISSYITYLVIFISLAIFLTSIISNEDNNIFEATKAKYAIMNNDKTSSLVSGLEEYLFSIGEEVEIEDNKEAIQDGAFYNAYDYILFIPEGFSESFINGERDELEYYAPPDSAIGFYSNSLVNNYLNLYSNYLKAGFSDQEEIKNLVLSDLDNSTEVEKKSYADSKNIPISYKTYSGFTAYITLLLATFNIGIIYLNFKKPEIRMKNLASPIKSISVNLQVLLFCVFSSIIIWLIINTIGILLNFSALSNVDFRFLGLTLINSLLMTFIALSLGLLISNIAKSYNTVSAVGNFISLILSFLGGVFLPLEYMGETVLNVAKLTPTYWYISSLDSISTLSSFSLESLNPVLLGFFIQIVFTLTFISLSLAIGKYKDRHNEDFSTLKTEIET